MAQTRGQATKKAAHQALVDSLDTTLSTGMEKSNFFLADDYGSQVEQACAAFIQRVKDNMNQLDLFVTGKIANITFKVKASEITIEGNPWVLYQDRGVNGSKNKKYNTPHSYTDKMPPVSVFEQYIKNKNIQLINNEKYTGDPSPFKSIDGDEKAIKKAAWGMAKKIFKDGFPPQQIQGQGFWQREIPQLIDDLKKLWKGFAVDIIKQNINAKLGNKVT